MNTKMSVAGKTVDGDYKTAAVSKRSYAFCVQRTSWSRSEKKSEQRSRLFASYARKGISTIIFLIIFLVIILLLFFTTPLYSKFIKSEGDIEGCHLSVMIAATGKQLTLGTQATKIQCQRTNVTITKSDAYSRKAFDEDKMKRKIAEQFRTCWYMFGEGAQPFVAADVIGYNTHCVICSEIKFDKQLLDAMRKDNVPFSFGGFHDYVASTVMGPGSYGNPDWTYQEYILKNLDDTTGLKALNAFTADPVETALTYAPAVTSADGIALASTARYDIKESSRLMLVWFYIKRGFATEDYSNLVLIPFDKFPKLQCEKQWN